MNIPAARGSFTEVYQYNVALAPPFQHQAHAAANRARIPQVRYIRYDTQLKIPYAERIFPASSGPFARAIRLHNISRSFTPRIRNEEKSR